MARSYVIVAADFVPWGGMDRPNYELAWYLAENRNAQVHLVSHQVAAPLSGHSNIIWHRVPRPFGRDALGSPLLDRAGRKVAKQISKGGGPVVVNGGNCIVNDANWVHYVHNTPMAVCTGQPFPYGKWIRWKQKRDQRRERQAIGQSGLIITDSELTKEHLIAGVPVDPERVHTVYYGIDANDFCPPSTEERMLARQLLGLSVDRPVAAFVGALGYDRRKGFDVLYDAWRQCCALPHWDASLVVAGSGPELPYWKRLASQSKGVRDVHFLGFTRAIPAILAAADVLLSPTRYEPYGQGVHEAICRGLPVFVTRSAGIAERFPSNLRNLLIDDPPDSGQLFNRLVKWRQDIDGHRQRMLPFAEQLRSRTWSDMASEIVSLLDASHNYVR